MIRFALPSVLDMWWRDVCTAHWRADAATVAALLPPELELDRYEGEAWLSVVPFRMTAVRPRFGPVVPGFAVVPEINLRTYVRAGDRRGIYFFSLDADAPLAVRAARAMTGLPYFHARIAVDDVAGGFAFASDRNDARGGAGAFRGRYRPYGPAVRAPDDSLAAFLHERYRFFVRRGATLHAGEVRHEPWLLQRAEVTIETNTLGERANHALPGAPEIAYFARGLRVRAAPVVPAFARGARFVAPVAPRVPATAATGASPAAATAG